jgi:hypothetical protein
MDQLTILGIREACDDMGCDVCSTDRFISLALGWLGLHHGTVVIDRIDDSWNVTAGGCDCKDDLLVAALAAVVIETGLWHRAKKQPR